METVNPPNTGTLADPAHHAWNSLGLEDCTACTFAIFLAFLIPSQAQKAGKWDHGPKPLDASDKAKSSSSSGREPWLSTHLRQDLFSVDEGLHAGIGSEKGQGAVRLITPALGQSQAVPSGVALPHQRWRSSVTEADDVVCAVIPGDLPFLRSPSGWTQKWSNLLGRR